MTLGNPHARQQPAMSLRPLNAAGRFANACDRGDVEPSPSAGVLEARTNDSAQRASKAARAGTRLAAFTWQQAGQGAALPEAVRLFAMNYSRG